jgi:hypothetical protein
MVSDLPIHGPLTREDERTHRIYYIIYSIDVRRDAEHVVGWMDPNGIPRGGEGPSLKGLWQQTEGDEQWDYDYLADEMAGSMCTCCGGTGEGEELHVATVEEDERFYGVGVTTSNWAGARTYVYESRPCRFCGGTGDGGAAYRNGFHRKWVAELNHAQFLTLANDRGMDLDDDERPIRFENTAGSITEYGWLGAYCVHDHEGWTYGGEIIDAQFYITEGCLPLGARSDITPNEGT